MTEATVQQPTTEQDRVIAAVTEALGDVLQRDLTGLATDTRLFDELGLDSTGVLDLLLALEELLDCEFDTENLEMSHFATAGSLADHLMGELRAQR
ncbi:phosphopantetheine-binding protein [Streptomyces sp. NPDC021749]|uniref:phosphopantetheine-binding protein n=1 Tax=Streptomyces sp. NPDC021749 TaxID=3154905 RepID=UPI00340F91E3